MAYERKSRSAWMNAPQLWCMLAGAPNICIFMAHSSILLGAAQRTHTYTSMWVHFARLTARWWNDFYDFCVSSTDSQWKKHQSACMCVHLCVCVCLGWCSLCVFDCVLLAQFCSSLLGDTRRPCAFFAIGRSQSLWMAAARFGNCRRYELQYFAAI